MHERQIQLELMFHKNQELKVLKQEFSTPAILKKLDRIGVPVKFGIFTLVQLYLHKQADVPTLVGILDNGDYQIEDIAKYLQIMAEKDLIDFNPEYGKFVTVFDVDRKIKKQLEKFQFPLPMIVEPRKIKNNHTNGYLQVNNESLLLNGAYHKEDICLDHINRVNRIPLAIDLDTAYACKNQWKNMDKRSPNESMEEFRKRKKNFEKYMNTAYTVMELVALEGNKVYFTHAYDKRGRTYTRGHHVNDQGNDWNKACIQFYFKEHVTE